MTPDETPAAATTAAAPPRAMRLTTKPVPPPVVRPPLPAMSSYSAPAPLPAQAQRSALERKLAGLYDATEMMQVLDTEVALQRVRRLHGGGSRQSLRVAALALFFTLFIAAQAAMFYLQSTLAKRGFSRHRADAPSTANPAPGPSKPAAARAVPAAGAAR